MHPEMIARVDLRLPRPPDAAQGTGVPPNPRNRMPAPRAAEAALVAIDANYSKALAEIPGLPLDEERPSAGAKAQKVKRARVMARTNQPTKGLRLIFRSMHGECLS